jgi:hypothetical protein
MFPIIEHFFNSPQIQQKNADFFLSSAKISAISGRFILVIQVAFIKLIEDQPENLSGLPLKFCVILFQQTVHLKWK